MSNRNDDVDSDDDASAAVRLEDLVREWIKRDPSLRKHIAVGTSFHDGFFIESTCNGRWTLAWVDGANVSTGTLWQGSPHFAQINPADPDYFEKLNKILRKVHNNAEALRHGCQIKL